MMIVMMMIIHIVHAVECVKDSPGPVGQCQIRRERTSRPAGPEAEAFFFIRWGLWSQERRGCQMGYC